MRNKVTSVINILLLVVLTSVTFFVIFSNNDIGEILDLVGNGDVKKLILGLFMALISVACEAAIIYILFTFLKERVKYCQCLKYSFIGFYYCAITPSATGGQPAQVYYMTKDGRKLSSSSLIVLVIIITYKIALLAMIGLLTIFNGHCMVSSIFGVKYFFFFGLIVNAACIFLYILVFFSSDLLKKVLIKIIFFLKKIKLIRKPEKMIDKVTNLIDEYKEGTTFIKNNLKILFPIMIVTCMQRLVMFSIPYVVYKFLGGAGVSYINFLTLQIVLNTSVDSLPLPGGIGASELAFNRIYSIIYSSSMIVPAMILTRGINFYCMLIISAVVSLIAHVRMSLLSKT